MQYEDVRPIRNSHIKVQLLKWLIETKTIKAKLTLMMEITREL